MLTNDTVAFDLLDEKMKVLQLLPTEVRDYFDINAFKVAALHYPVLHYPKKISSLSLDKTSRFQGKLTGIKGQYLIFENGTVFNVRSNEGYKVRISV
jgi:hypothetical protein